MEVLKRAFGRKKTATVGEVAVPEEMIGFELKTSAQREMHAGITRSLIGGLEKSSPELKRRLKALRKNLVGFSPEKKKARVKAVKSLVKLPIGVRERLINHLWFHPELQVRIAARAVFESLPKDSEVRRNIIEKDMIMARLEDAIWEEEFTEEREE